ncbi:MAG: DUF2271 domain-containing protein [Pirellulaceae bacterium]
MIRYLLVPLALIAGSFVSVSSSSAAELELMVEIPQLNVSEYHRPYIAAWIHDGDQKVVANLAVWYQIKDKGSDVGTKWLPDLRQWWRRTGRSLTLPVDGVTGATRPPGQHTVSFSDDQPQLAQLKPGEYILMVEASREVGGRELLKIPFAWPGDQSQLHEVQGSEELGKVVLSIKP